MSKAKNAEKSAAEKKDAAAQSGRGTRETIESIVIAVILAFLFRAFEAEAFVIPTGSMAPTLQGQHVDLECPKCKYRYRTGSSGAKYVGSTVCPICGYEKTFGFTADNKSEAGQYTYTGDRILVSKFAYELPGASPERWDVIVFKFPGNAKLNYIKRLIGLPGERIRIQYGNIYVERGKGAGFRIARKTEHSAAKLKAMLQLVDDTEYVPHELADAGWPSRWQTWPANSETPWQQTSSGNFEVDGKGGETWLRYRHVLPDDGVWSKLEAWQRIGKIADIDYAEESAIRQMLDLEHGGGEDASAIRELVSEFDANGNGVFDPAEKAAALREIRLGELITDFYAYNVGSPGANGENWVGDLALECELEVKSSKGELLLKAVRGGVHYDCRIDVATGRATLSIDGGTASFTAADGKQTKHPTAADCGIQGPGSYQVRFANVDNELVLWVNDQPVAFNVAATYVDPQAGVGPKWTQEEPGDGMPLGVGSNGAVLTVSRFKVLRDVYYVAASNMQQASRWSPHSASIMEDPEKWNDPSFMIDDRKVELPYPEGPNGDGYLGSDQYLPLGDNSPASLDARLWREPDRNSSPPAVRNWTIPTSVSRDMLLGKALFIYWPHPWHGFVPNFGSMGFIR